MSQDLDFIDETQPLVPRRADPYIYRHSDGYYYFTASVPEYGGNPFLVHHVRFDDGSEYHETRVRRLFRTPDGWLAAAPFGYNGAETPALDLSRAEASGYYWIVNHGLGISGKIEEAVETCFAADGTLRDTTGAKTGSWMYDGKTGNGSVTLGDMEFTGVFARENDEGGNPTLAFTGTSSGNEALWAVRY